MRVWYLGYQIVPQKFPAGQIALVALDASYLGFHGCFLRHELPWVYAALVALGTYCLEAHCFWGKIATHVLGVSCLGYLGCVLPTFLMCCYDVCGPVYVFLVYL